MERSDEEEVGVEKEEHSHLCCAAPAVRHARLRTSRRDKRADQTQLKGTMAEQHKHTLTHTPITLQNTQAEFEELSFSTFFKR